MADIDEVEEESQCSDSEVHYTPKKVPIWRIVLLSTMGGAVDLIVAVEAVYATPLLVAVGLDIQYASIILALSPILGILFQAYHGTLSDQCQCKWGRRRPFILIFSLSACIGMGVAPFAPYLSDLQSGKWLSILFTILGILIMDFSWGQLQLPSRAYLLDSLPTNQSQVGNFIYVLLVGLGTLIGYSLDGINWANILNREVNVINEAQMVYCLTIVVVLVALICTLLSIKERPYRPDDEPVNKRCCPCAKNPIDCLVDFFKVILESLKFFFYMSKQMWILWFACLSAFISNLALLLFFSTFVGRSVYGGIQDAPVDTEAYRLYTEGVRMSSWALVAGAGFLTLMSLLMDHIAKLIGLKILFFLVHYLYVLVLFVQTIFTNLAVAFFVACLGLLFQGIYLSIPFTLLSIYEDEGKMFRKPIPGESTTNFKGRACYVINTSIFLGQVTAAFITGPFINWFQTATASIMICCIFTAFSTILAIFVDFPDHSGQKL